MIKLNWPKFLLLWAILPAFLTASNLYAQEDKIVFDNIGQVYSSLYQLELCEEETKLLENKISQLEKNVIVLETENTLLEEQIDVLITKDLELSKVCEEQDIALKNMTNIIEMQKKGYEEVLKASKPTFFERLKEGVLFLGTGILIGILII